MSYKISVNFPINLQEKQQHFIDILCHLKAKYVLKFTDFSQRLQNLCKCANLQTLKFRKEI